MSRACVCDWQLETAFSVSLKKMFTTFTLFFRPTSLAWEVRKMSPGRHVMPSPSADRMVPSPGARRTLNFG